LCYRSQRHTNPNALPYRTSVYGKTFQRRRPATSRRHKNVDRSCTWRNHSPCVADAEESMLHSRKWSQCRQRTLSSFTYGLSYSCQPLSDSHSYSKSSTVFVVYGIFSSSSCRIIRSARTPDTQQRSPLIHPNRFNSISVQKAADAATLPSLRGHPNMSTSAASNFIYTERRRRRRFLIARSL
jgi:hypothetical protein